MLCNKNVSSSIITYHFFNGGGEIFQLRLMCRQMDNRRGGVEIRNSKMCIVKSIYLNVLMKKIFISANY